jgi:cell wall-associated NlpC family hydrolase
MPRQRQGVGRIIAVVVAVALVPAAAFNSSTVSADPVDDQRAEVERIADQLADLREQSDILAEDYVTAIDEKNRLDADVAKAEKRVAAKEAQVAALRGELGELAVRSFIGAGSNGLGPMFTASSEFTADLQRDQLSRVALSAGTATTDELDQAVADLEQERAALEDKRDEAAGKAEEVAAAKDATDEKVTEYQEARSDAEAKLGRLIQEEEERRARESFERMQREAQEAAAREAAAAQPPSDGDGGGGDGGDRDNGGGGGGDRDGDGGGGGAAPAPAPAPAPKAPSIPPASSRAGTAVNAAMTQVGVPYRYATAIPGVAFDCSGLTMWAWAQAGVGLPHQSRAQYASVPHVPSSAAQPGDLIFYYSPISHVGIYIGGGQMVHATNPGNPVTVSSVNWGNVSGVARPG